MVRAAVVHLGIIGGTITYVCIGAILFLYLERPNEMKLRQYHFVTYEKIKFKFLEKIAMNNLTENDLYFLSANYIEELFQFFKNSQATRMFEINYLKKGIIEDQWTTASSILFAATTVIPVGYGFVTPVTKLGRFMIVIYALIGAPMVLVSISDIAKFFSSYLMRFFPESITGLCILAFLIAYLFCGALFFSLFAEITYLEAAYFSITSVFTIGYGDTQPPISVPYLILYIVIGVILVTVAVQVLGTEAINHIHYMGRHVNRARKFTRRFYKRARKMNVRRGFNNGLMQIESFIRFTLIFGIMKINYNEKQNILAPTCNIDETFAPSNVKIKFVDENLLERISNENYKNCKN